MASGTYVLIQKLGNKVTLTPVKDRQAGQFIADHWCDRLRRFGPPYPRWAIVWIDYPAEQDWRG